MAKPIYPFFRIFRTKNIYIREFLAEFLGTFVLILFGDAAFAQDVLAGGGVKDVFAIVFGWGVGVMLGVAIAGGVTGGHLNPAVSFALATVKKLSWKKVPIYILAQHLGGFVASAVLFATYYEGVAHLDGGTRQVIGQNATALIWATYPKPFVSIGTCFLNEVVGTGLLTMTAVAIIDKKNLNFDATGIAVLLGFMITAVAMCFGFNNMAPLNPARDFPTRLFTAIAGYGAEPFTHRNYWWVGIVGPHVGGVVGVFLYYLCVELHWPDDKPDDHFDEELKTRKDEEQAYIVNQDHVNNHAKEQDDATDGVKVVNETSPLAET
ncbi:aquaporin-9-like isoform X2 [Centruroides vittatus]|uniref:aquaporin-9-like isoform X2 n=1 Tax=Centruroides vittatus TaxID=120091 RepID=UPI00351044F5